MSTWRESCGYGTVPSMTFYCSPKVRWERALWGRGEMSTWRESCGCGTVPSMTLNCSHGPILVVCSRSVAVMELKFAKDQGLCTTPSDDAIMDGESMFGEETANPENTALHASLLFADPDREQGPAPSSLVTGSEH